MGRNTIDGVAQGRHRRKSEGARHGAFASRPVRRRRDRGDDHRARRRRHRQLDRLGQYLQGRARESGPHFEDRARKGLDSGTAFEILSIDIADVDVGDNIGAKLQTEQAEADKRVAQAKAEVRRAAAVAVEQEMRAKTQEMRAKVVEAEAQVPQAMADAFRSGNLGIMDYVRMKNVQADTSMRSSIASGEKKQTDGTP